jgi:hypothetical protein
VRQESKIPDLVELTRSVYEALSRHDVDAAQNGEGAQRAVRVVAVLRYSRLNVR